MKDIQKASGESVVSKMTTRAKPAQSKGARAAIWRLILKKYRTAWKKLAEM